MCNSSHRRIDRVDVARRDRLQGQHDLRPDDERVDAVMRMRGMAAPALDVDVEAVRGGEHRTGASRHVADRDAGLVVHREHRVAGEFVEQPLLHHDPAAAIAFLARLEDEMHGAFEIARLGEVARRAEQHRRVPVMAAGMHLSVMRRAVRELVRLLHRQAVHIGPQPDRAQRVAAPDRADDPGLGQPAMHLAAIFGELLGDDIAGPLLGEAEFGMGVDIAADLDQLVEIIEDLGDYRHGGSGNSRLIGESIA